MVDVSTDGEYWPGLLPRPLAAALGGWWARVRPRRRPGVALTPPGRSASACSRSSSRSSLLPLAAVALALRPVVLDDPDVLGPRLALPVCPTTCAAECAPGSSGPALLLGARAARRARVVALGWSRVATISAEVGARPASAPRSSVPPRRSRCRNLATWAVSFLAGPGFRVVEGGAVTWSGSDGRAAADGARARGPAAAGRVPLVHGPVGARRRRRRGLRGPARPRRGRPALAAADQARGLGRRPARRRRSPSAVLDVVAGGSVGQFRLSAVGAPAGSLVLALFLELIARRARRRAPRRVEAAPVTHRRLRLVVLVSGSGSNLQALLDARPRAEPGSGSSPSVPTATAPAARSARRRTASRPSSPGWPTTSRGPTGTPPSPASSARTSPTSSSRRGS